MGIPKPGPGAEWDSRDCSRVFKVSPGLAYNAAYPVR